MGYSIYFKQVGKAPDSNQWRRIVNCAKEVFRENKEILCAESDCPKDEPIANHLMICFNGKKNEGHETFLLKPDMVGFNFCKTAEKPYTKAVVDVLKAVKVIAPDWLRVADDGNEYFQK